MKKALRCLLLSVVMALALGAAALAAETDPTVTAKNGASVAFQTGSFEKLTASYTDANLAGSQCIILGPGGVATAHSVHEYVSKKQLMMAAEIYRSMAMEICQVDE